MLFNSWVFAAFAIVVFALYHALRRRVRAQNIMLLGASYLFYGWWDWRFLSLILISTVVDYVAGRNLGRETRPGIRRGWLLLSVCANLGMLGFFKYFDFFIASAVEVLGAVGLNPDVRTLNIVLPAGISFYTFQTMSYTIDVYRRDLKPERDPLDFALFVAYFPQLMAGPIERAGNLLPQLKAPRTVTRDQVISGSWLILWGFFKKLVIADNLALAIVDPVFAEGADPTGLQVYLGMCALTYQFYCDFSGYTDIARGLAKLMGIELMLNFNMPMLARSPQDFWRRWHISLSLWLRDYVYFSLGGNRRGVAQTYFNVFLTMFLGGIWHGATAGIFIWSFYMAAMLTVYRLYAKLTDGPWKKHPAWQVFSVVAFWHWFLLGWIFFRSLSVPQMVDLFTALLTNFTLSAAAAPMLGAFVFFVAVFWVFEAWLQHAEDPRTRPGWSDGLGAIAVGVIVVLLITLTPPANRAFLYFQF